MKGLEDNLFLRYSCNPEGLKIIFVVGPPRTGTTVIYQSIINRWNLGFFSNLVNEYFSKTPIIGVAVHKSGSPGGLVSYMSRFGYTIGLFGPSEATSIFKNWWNESYFLPDMESHFVKTLTGMSKIFGSPIVIKNIWNSFRIDTLARIFPQAYFVFVTRDIRDSCVSELFSRYVTRNTPDRWTPARRETIKRLERYSYCEQIVENQIDFRTSLVKVFNALPVNRRILVGLEDFCDSPKNILECIGKSSFLIKRKIIVSKPHIIEEVCETSDEELFEIGKYIDDREREFDRCGFYQQGEDRSIVRGH